ncbi:urea carboxylase [Cryptococcus wingfieldii CBS 7118]|uniref:Urea carboxylase n=1 Tax=Cryptococcus wingfieldii CBS 7118 TaxID=1295528 RepID=A0A1E3K700_9TREE|nr:urea carboxylase [Cryptococcus wingfieldii CBS 7118]ODO08964.1 urea carboxylase [Cryptococcus wingfieldii CBS 7118]
MPPPKLLIANRGEIALRIIRSAIALSIPTIAIFTQADAASPHVLAADEAYPVGGENGDGSDPKGYLDIGAIVGLVKKSGATMVAPGYGFLSENAAFAEAIEAIGVTFLGPTPYQMTSMGLKHEARAVAKKAGVPIVPGSEGAVASLEDAVQVAGGIGYPVLVKASGGGGGMGMQVCRSEQELVANFESTRAKGAALFKEPTVFLEKFITRARHVEVQIFGNGQGHVVHMGERECSVQRRHQKVIEEAPCVLFSSEMGKGVRKRMCEAAVKLGELMKYRSAGTVEFVLDVDSPTYEFYFLELNARIQVEHAITEVTHPGLDLVALMIRQGLSPSKSLPPSDLVQEDYLPFDGHAIEVRVYCENPKAGFKPCPGQLHEVLWGSVGKRGRIDTWVKTGTTVTPHYDPMIAKVVVHGETRDEAIANMLTALDDSRIIGPTTNLDYCKIIMSTPEFEAGEIHTTFLDSFVYAPPAIEVLSAGLSTTVQDLPGRFVGKGIPRGGAADGLALSVANLLVGNGTGVEGLEMTMMGAKLLFHVDSVVAVTGCQMPLAIDGQKAEMWSSLPIRAGQTLRIGSASSKGLRSYLAVRGGLLNVSTFEGSKSTFTGAALGGYQGRALIPGDLLTITPSSLSSFTPSSWPSVPAYGNTWQIDVCPGPQWDEEYLSEEGMKTLLEGKAGGGGWKVSPASNRSGLRLEGPRVKWARTDGGEGGSHPSNVVDQGYPFAALNMNGDTPVLFGVDAPDMGGFSCVLTVATHDLWKLGQIRPGDSISFNLIPTSFVPKLLTTLESWLSSPSSPSPSASSSTKSSELLKTNVLHRSQKQGKMDTIFRSSGDRFITYEIGPMALDLPNRVLIELWERSIRSLSLPGIISFSTCIRSCIVHFDPTQISQEALLKVMVEEDGKLGGAEGEEIETRVWKFPAVVDDKWCKEAVEYYMKTARKEAVYLPSNADYLAKNNGLGQDAVYDMITKTPWLVLAQGFFVMLPFMIPLDPRLRLVGQKYNPSRTKTPEGAIGLAGVIGAIYPIASAGGYQLLGRTLTPWNAWAKEDEGESKTLLSNFDQIEFYPVKEAEFIKIEQAYKAGSFKPTSSQKVFKVAEYLAFVASHAKEVEEFKKGQKEASEALGKQEEEMFSAFQADSEKTSASATSTSTSSTSDTGAPGGGGLPIVSPLAATVWKILLNPGDVIEDEEQNVVELEAMKTSVFVPAGEEVVGRKVKSVVVKEGEGVNPGDVLVTVE